MELWIRSQDKEILIKVDRIGIEKFDEGYGIVTYERIGTKNEFGLGLYTTRERALEVLDEIQEKITQFNVKTDYGCVSNIYEMPKE